MSERAEEFAARLLDSTLAGKLQWSAVPDPEVESYKYEAEDGISFRIKREAKGDDKSVTFELIEVGRVVLTDTETNIPYATNSELVRDQAMAFLLNLRSGERLPRTGDTRIKRFRLYSDLFYAARETAEGKDMAIEKAQQFLSKLA
jgi:hypothetical protein